MPLIRSGAVAEEVVRLVTTRDTTHSPGTRLPEPPDSAPLWLPTGFGTILERRHARKDFDGRHIPVAELADILSRARIAERSIRPADEGGHTDLTVLVATRRVEGLPPGLHQWHAATGSSWSIAAATSESPADLFETYTDAAALVLICHPLAPVGEDSAGYGSLLVAAGAFGYGAWLAAVGLGFAGCPFGRTHHAVTRVAQEIDPRLRHAFTLALGRTTVRRSDPGISYW